MGRVGGRLPGWEAAVGASTSPLSVLGATGGRKSPREADGGMAAETNAGSQQGKERGYFFLLLLSLVAVPFRSNPPALAFGLPRRVFRRKATVGIGKVWVAAPRYTWGRVCLGGRKRSSHYAARKAAAAAASPPHSAPQTAFPSERRGARWVPLSPEALRLVRPYGEAVVTEARGTARHKAAVPHCEFWRAPRVTSGGVLASSPCLGSLPHLLFLLQWRLLHPGSGNCPVFL